MVSAIHWPAEIEVDLLAIKKNLQAEKAHLKPGQKLFAVIKANAYGHSAVKVAKIVARNSADGFCVAVLNEAFGLQDVSIVDPTLVLGVTPVNKACITAAYNISLIALSLERLKTANMALAKKDIVLRIHLTIDSGMGRIGFSEDREFTTANEFPRNSTCFIIEGMFTYFASADSANSGHSSYQIKRFNHLKNLLSAKPKWIYAASTASSIFGKQVHPDIVRFGVGLYGSDPSSNPTSPDLESRITLKPALSSVSKLSFVEEVYSGYGVGYGSTYVTDSDQRIGTVPVGYADGITRKLSDFKVKVGDNFCPIVGRICMDQLMVLLPEKMPAGTKVVIHSNKTEDPSLIKGVADYVDTTYYELVCLLSDRLPRTYHGQKKQLSLE